MAITRDFNETVQERALRDTAFREGLLRESVENMLAGDTNTGKALLTDYINAAVGFEGLGRLVHKSPASLMRMCSPEGDPTADDLFTIIYALQQKEGLHFQVQAVYRSA
jgi:hypothetical protein